MRLVKKSVGEKERRRIEILIRSLAPSFSDCKSALAIEVTENGRVSQELMKPLLQYQRYKLWFWVTQRQPWGVKIPIWKQVSKCGWLNFAKEANLRRDVRIFPGKRERGIVILLPKTTGLCQVMCGINHHPITQSFYRRLTPGAGSVARFLEKGFG